MFSSIKDWMNVPVSVKPFDKRSGSGDKIFKDVIAVKAYPVYEVKYVQNSLGADVLSSHHFYIDGNVSLSALDEVLVDSEWLPIQAVEVFFRNGVPDIKVVHV